MRAFFPSVTIAAQQAIELDRIMPRVEDALAGVFGRLGIGDEAAWSAARAMWIRNGVPTVH